MQGEGEKASGGWKGAEVFESMALTPGGSSGKRRKFKSEINCRLEIYGFEDGTVKKKMGTQPGRDRRRVGGKSTICDRPALSAKTPKTRDSHSAGEEEHYC
ncbi:MAG TPA: hypothetical protein VMA34_00250 [Terracidiphilus sp.]|nr:hypothetical protein [Terracidiphilus sp.]